RESERRRLNIHNTEGHGTGARVAGETGEGIADVRGGVDVVAAGTNDDGQSAGQRKAVGAIARRTVFTDTAGGAAEWTQSAGAGVAGKDGDGVTGFGGGIDIAAIGTRRHVDHFVEALTVGAGHPVTGLGNAAGGATELGEGAGGRIAGKDGQ